MKRYEMKSLMSTIKKWEGAEVTRDDLVNDLLRNALYHSVLNNQATPAYEIVKAIGKAGRRTDMINYMTKYGNFIYGEKEGVSGKHFQAKLRKGDDALTACWKDEDKSWAYVESLPNFWDDLPEKEPNYDFDLDAYLSAVRKTITRKIKTAAEHNGKVTGKEKIEGFNKALESIGITV